ncbi:helix-turn-helix domain-containing protein [Marinoscillum sp. 108]|uniref:helix-turn-helix domain-containing protein n=1 Tax=Marinoscillum sp. 108 TaxID=2653151 RepID=UPI0012F3376C|nr:helix-turn-helix transcriptional regulator [Marinoscillum sp. 108]VXD19610.1 Transcriptional regulator [Marinoscillum sp. 108]
MKETIGEYIHKLRIESGMTLTKLAAALDIDQSTLSKIENGKRNIPRFILPKLAETFKLDIKRLEKEFFSEMVAEIIYSQEEPQEVLKLAEEKAKYFKTKKEHQGSLSFEKGKNE